MSIFVAILGLGFLILIHEAGHFFVALRGRDEPAQVLHRLPAGAREDDAERDRVRHRRDPARRLREDPGMHRPAPGDLDVHFGRAVEEAPELGRRRRAPAARARRGRLHERARSRSRARARRSRRELSPPRRARPPSVASTRSATRSGRTRTGARATWKRVAVIFAGPAANLVLARRPLRRALHGRRRQGDATRGQRSSPARRPRRSGLPAGDQIVAINGQPVDAERDLASDLRVGRPPDHADRRARRGRDRARADPRRSRPTASYRLGFLLAGGASASPSRSGGDPA